MPVRLRKFIGTIAIVTLVIVYALTATMLATVVLDGRSAVAALIYFVLTGINTARIHRSPQKTHPADTGQFYRVLKGQKHASKGTLISIHFQQ